MTEGRIVQINVSPGGVPKLPIEAATVGSLGIDGDQHRYHLHGGPQKALLLIASEFVDQLITEGWPLFYGALGENLTTRGLDHRNWRTGQRFQARDLVFELTGPRHPCSQLNPYGPGIQKRIFDDLVEQRNPASAHWGESGFYASVITSGSIQPNDIIKLVDPVV